MKRVTMQDIADLSGLSRVTVSKALNNKPVSPEIRNKVIQTAARLGYQNSQIHLQETLNTAAKQRANVAVAVSRPTSSVFWMNIIHSMAKAVSEQAINLNYVYLPQHFNANAGLPLALREPMPDIVVVLNVYDEPLFLALNALPLPKIFLDCPPSVAIPKLSGDIVYTSGSFACEKLTEQLLSQGVHKIGFIGDTHYASTNRFRYEGFCAALDKRGMIPSSIYSLTGPIPVFSYKETIETFLHDLLNMQNLPEAFVCVSDFVAHFVYDFLSTRGWRVPDDLLLTGFDGNVEYNMALPGNFFSTAIVDSGALGSKLIRQTLYRLENPHAPLEISYLLPEVAIGESSVRPATARPRV